MVRLMTEEEKKEETCPICGSKEIIYDTSRGEKYCSVCGTVLEENIIDFGPEWRAYDAEQRKSRARVGSPIKYTRANKGLTTEIDTFNRDYRNVKIKGTLKSKVKKLRKWHKRSSISNSLERNLSIALQELNRICAALDIPENLREQAALLYRKSVEKGMIRGRLIESVVAAIIYIICRKYGIPRTMEEISEYSGVEERDIGRTFRFLKKDLNIEIPLSTPEQYVPRFASELGLPGEAQEIALKVLEEAKKRGLISGKGPVGIAAASIYIATQIMKIKKTQKEVADVAKVTEVTIRNRYRELKEKLEDFINQLEKEYEEKSIENI